jgi:hypothetical protein
LYQIYKLGGSFEVWPYWDILDLTTPQGLLNCIFFYNGKNLCLRGGEEHRKLTFSQLKRETKTVNGVQKTATFTLNIAVKTEVVGYVSSIYQTKLYIILKFQKLVKKIMFEC